MLRTIDYNRTRENINRIVKIKRPNEKLLLAFKNINSSLVIDYKKKVVSSSEIYTKLHEEINIRGIIDEHEGADIYLDIFLLLYIHLFLSENILNCKTYNEILSLLHSNEFYCTRTNLQDDLDFLAISYFLCAKKTGWLEFTSGFDPNDWSNINLLASLLPISQSSLNDLLEWITVIAKTQDRDLAFGNIGISVYNWVLQLEDFEGKREEYLLTFANHPQASRFFSGFVKGLRDREKKEAIFYSRLLGQSINFKNAFTILYGIGSISQDCEEDKENYFKLITEKLNSNILIKKDFIRLCCYYNYYNEIVYEKINSVIDSAEEKDELLAIIEFLQKVPPDIELKWFSFAAHIVISKKQSDLKHSLNILLMQVANFNLALAYDLFTFRLQIVGGEELLETALLEMIRKDTNEFQVRFIKWLITEDEWIHNGVLHISSLTSIDKSLFSIPAEVYDTLQKKQKLFTAYKIVGYVYSMEVLQSLILSLIKSIKEDCEVLNEGLNYILLEYLIYNYRGTLQIIRKDLNDPNLTPFARSLFETSCNYFENYFNNLRSITVKKEITPNKEQTQLRDFYQRKLFADLPKKNERNSITSLFKSTQVNANNWAIRRPNELKHKPSPLGHFSVNTEFPSGEKLNPIYQEYIRRTYQNLKLNEINID